MTARKLWLLRHAKSDWTQSQEDFERPLNSKGQHQIVALTAWMQTHECRPQQIISSPAVRALTTAQHVSTQLAVPLIENSAIYEADLDTLLSIIHALDNTQTEIMLVGHNPGLSMLLGYLAGWREIKQFEYNGEVLRPASLAQIQTDLDWSELGRNTARCLSVTHGKKLAKK